MKEFEFLKREQYKKIKNKSYLDNQTLYSKYEKTKELRCEVEKETFENVLVDPEDESFCYLFGKKDCHKLVSGTCTFDLTPEEYEKRLNLKTDVDTEKVDYCRVLLRIMKSDNYLTSSLSIEATRKKCGHIQFDDGQHRSCIAKKKAFNTLLFDKLTIDEEKDCFFCRGKEDYITYEKLHKQ
ncbi:hypothetical protein [Domibacillus sp.]|uniref:hypothetical protein n=1 Tax=Domibacillus sp. TaxID=1969783 RepID=UPI002811CF74|nr:hypothetical protein [Domibacillus sp.]